MALYITDTYNYKSDNQVVHTVTGVRPTFTKSATIRKTDISPDSLGQYKLPSGFFIARMGTTYRPMPQMRLTTATTTSSPRFKVSCPYIFKAGDVLNILKPYTVLTVSGTGAGSLALNGRVVSYNPVGAANATEAATLSAKYYNDSVLGNYLDFIAAADKLWVFAKDGFTLYTVTPTGTLGSSGVTLALNTTAIGTVMSVDASTDEVVLTSNAAVAVPVGVSIGVVVDEVYGIHIGSVTFKQFEDRRDIPVCSAVQLRLPQMPFWDDYVKRDVPNLEARTKW